MKKPLKDLGALEEYISNEGNLPMQMSKCKACVEENCKVCLKTGRSDPTQQAVIEEMKTNIERNQKEDDSTQFSIKYTTYVPLSSTFKPELSNFDMAKRQSNHVFLR